MEGENRKTEELEIDELKFREDINHSLKMYVVEDLDTEEDVREGLNIINDLSKKFRHCHVELKSGLENYAEVYPDYDKISDKLILFVKKAKKRLNVVKSNECSEQSAANDKKRIGMFFVDHELLALKISQFEGMIDISYVQNTAAIDEYLSKMEEFLKEYFELSRNLKYYLGEKYYAEFGQQFELKTHKMREDMKMAIILKEKNEKAFQVECLNFLKYSKNQILEQYDQSKPKGKALRKLLKDLEGEIDELEEVQYDL